ncbi:MAG: hypothetical protein JW860_14815 [Sedimentisphaerales bacterium]|nr:hypothetical protein [Sedimentisphaerales bacterium]
MQNNKTSSQAERLINLNGPSVRLDISPDNNFIIHGGSGRTGKSSLKGMGALKTDFTLVMQF